MYTYFLKRLVRQKTMYLAIAVGALISTGYIIQDVLPFTARSLHHSPYTKWIESMNVSSFATLLFMLMPILASMAFAHIYRQDKNNNYLSMILVKGKKKQYFTGLYLFNFILGGITFAIPLLWNIYLCFMLLPNEKTNFLLDVTQAVNYNSNDTLFPQLYYDHPFLHMLLYVMVGFLVAGIFATVALAASMYLKQIFFVWLIPFVYNYIYTTVLALFVDNGAPQYMPTRFCIETGSGIQMMGVILFLVAGLVVPTGFYLWGVKKNEVL